MQAPIYMINTIISSLQESMHGIGIMAQLPIIIKQGAHKCQVVTNPPK